VCQKLLQDIEVKMKDKNSPSLLLQMVYHPLVERMPDLCTIPPMAKEDIFRATLTKIGDFYKPTTKGSMSWRHILPPVCELMVLGSGLKGGSKIH